MMMNEMILIAGLWAISYTVVDIFMADEWKFNTHRGKLKTLLLAPFLFAVLALITPYLLATAFLKWLGDHI